jgi:hypothetical protein
VIYKDAIGRYNRAEWAGLTIKCLLLDGATSTYSPVNTHLYVADLTPGSNELACTGYARQTVTLSAPTWDATGSGSWRFLASSVVFPALGTGADQAGDVVFYQQVGGSPNDAVDLLICHSAQSPVTLDGGGHTVTIGSGGLYRQYVS